jgi:uncharacterized protein (TIGR01777 family)
MESVLLLLSIQGFIGAYDSIYHHDFKERLSLKSSAKNELKIHSIRSALYSVLFLSFGWVEWYGVLAMVFATIVVIELILTLWDFIEEDRSRLLPATERVTHTILALNFGAILALFVPELQRWQALPTGWHMINHGTYSWIMTLYGVGVIPFAIREYMSYQKLSLNTNVNIAYQSLPTQNILVTGATGFIGQQLCKILLSQGHFLTLLVRDYQKAAAVFGNSSRLTLISSLTQVNNADAFDMVINLAGEPITTGRWNPAKKKRIMDSRLDITRQIIDYIETANTKPTLFISGSAIGFYGPHEDETLTESSKAKLCFSHDLCAQWEDTARQAEPHGVRICLLRTGIVLGKTGGALAAMRVPFTYGLGGRLGDGRQWMSWIHIDDVVGIILEIMKNEQLSGPVNLTAPNPVSNTEFTKTLGSSLHRPTVIAMPAFALRLLMGEVADELLLSGQKVVPEKIIEHGYQFNFPDLSGAIASIVHS